MAVAHRLLVQSRFQPLDVEATYKINIKNIVQSAVALSMFFSLLNELL